MTSHAAPDSLSGAVDTPDGKEVQVGGAEQGGEGLFELVDDKFVVVSIDVEYVADLAWPTNRASSDRKVYVRFSIDPGNVQALTDPFIYSERCSKPVEMGLPMSLTTESAGALMEMEVWEVRLGGVQQELVGKGRKPVHELLRDSKSQEILLTRRRRKASCGKLEFSVTMNSDSRALAAVFSREIQESMDKVDDGPKNAQLFVMVLESQGLDQLFNPVIVVSTGEAKLPLRTDSATYDDKRGVFVWNYRLCFELPPANLLNDTISFTMIHDEEVNDSPEKVLGSATINCAALEPDGSVFCGWLTFSAPEQQGKIRVRVACCLIVGDSQVDVVEVPVADCETLESPTITSDVYSSDKPFSIPLGSLLEVQLEFICATSTPKSEYLSEYIGEGQQLSIRGRVNLLDGVSQRATTNASASLETAHCKKQTCARLQSENGDPVVLRFELSPDVVTNSLPQLCLDFRPKRSQQRPLSLSIALPYLLKQLLANVEYQCDLPLIDQNGCVLGRLGTCFRTELQSDQQHILYTPVVHKPQACILTVKVASLRTSNEDNNGIRCLANIWSSTTDKAQAQTISPLRWTSGEVGGVNAVSLNVSDATTGILFVGIYRFSNHERNELIGLGIFSICSHQLNQSFEQSVRLFCNSKGKETECGSMVLGLQTASVPDETESERSLSLAASELGSVAYPVQNGEMKCGFDIDILEVHELPATVSEGDSISIQLRIAQSNWKIKLGPTKVVPSAGGNKLMASIDGKAYAKICWSAKDRSFPELEVLVYTEPQRTPTLKSIASNASLATTSHLKRRGDRRGAKATQRADEAVAPVLVAAGSLNLCSFFSQPNTSAHVDLSFTVEKTDTETVNCEGPVSILSTIRASSYREEGASTPTLPETNVRQVQVIKGDLCIHLLQATGSFLRKVNPLSSYYVLASCGSEEVVSGFCSADDGLLTWNQHVVLRIGSNGPPTVHLTLYHRLVDRNGGNSNLAPPIERNQIVGYLTLPMFPSVLEEDHLLQLEVPFGMPFGSGDVDSTKTSNDPHYYKRGMLTLEMQFLSSEQPKVKASTTAESFELVIHRVRGNLQDSSPSQRPPGVVQHVFVDISLMSDRGGRAEELAVGATGVISISASGMTEVGEVVDLSNPIIAATLLNGPNNVFVGRVRDLAGNYYGRVHLPLRKDWRQRLVDRRKQVWYPICIEASTEVTTTKDALLISLQLREQNLNTAASQAKASGKFHVSVCEAILSTPFQSSNALKLGRYGGANVQLTHIPMASPDSEVRYRTRQSTSLDSSQHWRWENEWFAFTQDGGQNTTQELQVSLQIGVQPNRPVLDGSIDLSSTIKDARFRRVALWIPLGDQLGSDRATVDAHLHIVVIYIPIAAGRINFDFGESVTFSESERRLHVDTTFYKCALRAASYISTDDQGNNALGYKRLRLPYDTSVDTTPDVPVFVIQWMGATKTLGEVCLGVFSIDLLSISELCCLTSGVNSSDTDQDRFIWGNFYDKVDRTKISGVAKLRVTFDPTRNVVHNQEGDDAAKTLENRIASAETFTIWKKLFYLLDQNSNGYIGRNEFTNVFLTHVEDMTKTSDGQKLLQLLFGSDDNQDSTNQANASPPTQEQIAALFSVMDTNRDNEIEWSEYLRFLQRKQHQLFNSTKESEENPAHEPTEIQSQQKVQSQQKRELRKKHREDPRAIPPTIEGQSTAASNQTEPSPEEMRSADPKNVSVKQGRSAPKRAPKVSSSEHKLLKLQYSNQEQSRLQEQITSLEAILAIERRRYAELAADRQALMRSYQQLHLKHQNELIQEQTKSKWMKQTIERQQQQLEEREAVRKNRTQASIVLQSTVRSRLEQKRYQGLKLQRANAAIAIQCLARTVKAKGIFQALQEADRVKKQRIRAASRMQKFIRFHLHRKERALLIEARNLSATILQKNTRRMIASRAWQRQKVSTVKLQCWIRRRQAIQLVTRIRDSTFVVKMYVLGWFARWKYSRIKESTRRIQRWWRRSSKERSAYMELLEAVLCIQSAWKRRSARKWFKREWQRQETYLSQLEAAICIQAAWRGQRQRLVSYRSLDPSPRFEDDSVVEALLYDIVAIIEADAVPCDSNEPTLADTSAGGQNALHSGSTGEDGNLLVANDSSDDQSVVPQLNPILSTDEDNYGASEESAVSVHLRVLVDAVASTSESDPFCTKAMALPLLSRDLTPVDMNSTDTTMAHSDPPIDHDTEDTPAFSPILAVEEADTSASTDTETAVANSLTPEATGEDLHDSDNAEFAIVENVLEAIIDLVASQPAHDKESQADRIASMPYEEDQGSSHDETHDIKTNQPSHEPDTGQGSKSTDNLQAVDVMELTSPSSVPANEPEYAHDDEAPQAIVAAGTLTEAFNTSSQREDTGAVEEGIAQDVLGLAPADASSVSEESYSVFQEVHEEVNSTIELSGDEILTNRSGGGDNQDVNDAASSNEAQTGEIVKRDTEVHKLDAAFDADSVTVGDFAMPNGSDSDDPGLQNGVSDDESAGGSSIDSSDLMLEADAMAVMQQTNTADDQIPIEGRTKRHRKTERLDSMALLADLDKLDAHGNSDSTEDKVDTNTSE